ncbi:MAG: threonine--tRNA ligase [Nitrospirota bacterium]
MDKKIAKDKVDIDTYRHSTSHVLAQAVQYLFKGAKLGIGPSIKDGFYYDFEYERPFTPEDMEKIEARMKTIIEADIPICRREISKSEAINEFKEREEVYKIELISDIEDEKVTIYQQGDFADLCRGPHLSSTGMIKAFKLLSVAGAYWKGDESNAMLQRIYGTSFFTEKELDEYLKRIEEAKKRDHRRLGKELDLFSINDDIGAGLILWHPKGAAVRRIIEDFWKDEHLKNGYDLLYSPHIAKIDLWEKSGHLEFYKENMYSPIDIEGVEYQLKPMNCPFHIACYRSHLRSYRDMPIRWAELGTVYRYERSGVLHGLMRVRGFTQDDAHIFCREEQLEDEIIKVLDFTIFVLKTFGFSEYDIFISTRPEKFVGSLKHWEAATSALENAIKKRGMTYQVDKGEGVFYGPKIDIKIKDVLGRTWQCSTIQVDFNIPDRFSLSYIGNDGREHQPIMIHRALMGSLERFFGILLEHYGGAFPVWLAPVQVMVIPITDKQREYAEEIKDKLLQNKIRTVLDSRSEKVGLKIRETELAKVPYMLIIGKREMDGNMVSIRKRNGKVIGEKELSNFVEMIEKEVKGRSC